MTDTIPNPRRRNPRISPVGVMAVTEEIMAEMEHVLAEGRARGVRPGDGTAAGKFMAREQQRLDYHRAQLANARREAHSWYDPLATR
jgi:hypothetical protein